MNATTSKHTEAPSRIELPGGWYLSRLTRFSYALGHKNRLSNCGRVNFDLAQQFAAAMNHALQPACNCGKGKPVCTCTAQTPPSESAVACAREIMKGRVFRVPNGSYEGFIQDTALAIQRFADAQATGGGKLRKVVEEIWNEYSQDKNFADKYEHLVNEALSADLPAPAAIASPVRSPELEKALEWANKVIEAPLMHKRTWDWNVDVTLILAKALKAQLEAQACAGGEGK